MKPSVGTQKPPPTPSGEATAWPIAAPAEQRRAGLIHHTHATELLRRACRAAEQKRKVTTVTFAVTGLLEFAVWLLLHALRLLARGIAWVASTVAAAAAALTGPRPVRSAQATRPGQRVAAVWARCSGLVVRLLRRLRPGGAARFTAAAECGACAHPLATHTADLGCWLCTCLYLRDPARGAVALPELPKRRVAGLLPPAESSRGGES